LIDRTFRHCHGVGPRRDAILKAMGYGCWRDCLERSAGLPFSGPTRERFLEAIRRSQAALENEELGYLTTALPGSEHWRILAAYHEEATYFDIETTGLSSRDATVTVISAYCRGDLFSFVHDRNLDDFLQLVDRSKLLVSFNGSSFDIPFLTSRFNLPDIGCPCIDLRWICYHHGYRGGLKAIEKQLHLDRPADVRQVDGLEAVMLFHHWQRGDAAAGRKLVRYCESDVLATYLVAGRLLDEMGLDIRLPDASALFSRAGRGFVDRPL